MKNCIFCKIVAGEIPSAKIWEDKEFLAVLDAMPNTEGMTLVISKKHYPSYAFDLPNKFYERLMLAAKKVAKLLDKKLGVQRTAMTMEGIGVNHVHIKLYPLHGLKNKHEEIMAKKKIFFKKYPGYLTTLSGPKADSKELEKLAKKIR